MCGQTVWLLFTLRSQEGFMINRLEWSEFIWVLGWNIRRLPQSVYVPVCSQSITLMMPTSQVELFKGNTAAIQRRHSPTICWRILLIFEFNKFPLQSMFPHRVHTVTFVHEGQRICSRLLFTQNKHDKKVFACRLMLVLDDGGYYFTALLSHFICRSIAEKFTVTRR